MGNLATKGREGGAGHTRSLFPSVQSLSITVTWCLVSLGLLLSQAGGHNLQAKLVEVFRLKERHLGPGFEYWEDKRVALTASFIG